MDRTYRQSVGARLAADATDNIILHYVPRFGKTNVIKMLIGMDLYKDVLIIVHNDTLKRHWEHHIGTSRDFTSITIETAHRIVKNDMMLMPDLVVLDEIHKYLTPELSPLIRTELFSGIKHIGLTGTIPVADKKAELSKYFRVADIITEEEALANNWISNYTEYNLGLDFPEKAKEKYKSLTETIKAQIEIFRGSKSNITIQGRPIFNTDIDVIYACTRGTMYNNKFFKAEDIRAALSKNKGWTQQVATSDSSYAEVLDKFWNPVAIKDNAMAFSRATMARNALMTNSMAKKDQVLAIISKFNVPTIVYNESIDFAETVALNMEQIRPGKVCIHHSKLESRYLVDRTTGEYISHKNGNPKLFGSESLKKLAIEGLKTGKFTILSTVKTLDEGIDIPNLQLAIITAGTVNPLQQQQRSGRVKTIDLLNAEKDSKIINLYFRDFFLDGEFVKSRDLTKLIIRQSENKIEPIWINSVSEIC